MLTVLFGLEPSRVFQAVSACTDFNSESDSSGDETEDDEGAGVQTVATLRRKAAVNPIGGLPLPKVVIQRPGSNCDGNLLSASCSSPSGLGFMLRC
jgi:hypothetical protein